VTEFAQVLCRGIGKCLVALMLTVPWTVLAEEPCNDPGVVFAFFNGVQTTEDQAKEALEDHLANTYGPTTPAGHPVTYDLFYNDTEGLSDFAETFDQRLREHNAVLTDRFELFFAPLKGQREGGWWGALIEAVPAAGDLFTGLMDTAMANAMHQLTRPLQDPSLAEVSLRHRAQIERWAAQDHKLLLFAHSQGNLFVNMAFQHALGQTDSASVRVLHVAPASPTLSGRHTLADKDFVINALRATGLVAPNTDLIIGYATRPAGLNGQRDLMGHGLLEIYLNAQLPTSSRLGSDVRAALAELEQAPRKPLPPFPDFEPQPFAGGSTPALALGEASHALERIEHSDSADWVFTKEWGRWHARRDEASSEGLSGTFLMRYVGKGMGGFHRCDWDWVPMEGWEAPQQQMECTKERVPSLVGLGLEVAELAAHADAPVGTQVRLNRMTWTAPRLQLGGDSLERLEVRFTSATMSTWVSNAYVDVKETTEPYVAPAATPESLAAYRAWQLKRLAHEESEGRRYEAYLAEREAYEKRRACRGV
jgi:hypothetical protein